MSHNSSKNGTSPAQKCKDFVGVTFADGSGKIVGLLLAYVLTNLAHHLLKPMHQPRITSDIVVSINSLFVTHAPASPSTTIIILINVNRNVLPETSLR